MATPMTKPAAPMPIGPAVSQAEAEGPVTPEVLPKEALACINTPGLQRNTAVQLRTAFNQMFADADVWLAQAAVIRVTSADQTADMARAKELRLKLKEIRCNCETTRKLLKADSLAQGKAIDGIANVLKGLTEPAEKWLLEQEEFAERLEQKRIDDLRETRRSILAPYSDIEAHFQGIDLAYLTDEAFSAMHEGMKLEAQHKADVEKTAEVQRLADEQKRKAKEIEDEAERKRLKDANDILQEEARKANTEAERLRKEAADTKAEADRVASEKARADKAEADRLAKAAAKAASAPDKEKVLAFVAALQAVKFPKLSSPAGKSMTLQWSANLDQWCDELKNEANDRL